jgi:hypothetical protein
MQTTDSPVHTGQVLTLDHFVGHWQLMVDLLARQADVPCALINRMDGSQLVLQVTNSNGKHPFFASQTMPLQLNSYCANVLRTQKPLHVADASQLPEMHDNPTAALGLVFYHGYPLYWPDGHLFGTICILDYFNRPMDEQHSQLLQLVKEAIEGDLALFDQNIELQQQLQNEKNYNHQLMLSLQQSHYSLPQLSDLLADLMKMLQQQMLQSQQQLQLMQNRLQQPEHKLTLPLLKPSLQQLKQQSSCWAVLSGMLEKLSAFQTTATSSNKVVDLAERGAYQASLLLKASPKISCTVSPRLACSLAPQLMELLCCALSCYLLNHSLSRAPELSINAEQQGPQLQLSWILWFPSQKTDNTEADSTEPFWTFSQYLAKLSDVKLQRHDATDRLQINLYLTQVTEQLTAVR